MTDDLKIPILDSNGNLLNEKTKLINDEGMLNGRRVNKSFPYTQTSIICLVITTIYLGIFPIFKGAVCGDITRDIKSDIVKQVPSLNCNRSVSLIVSDFDEPLCTRNITNDLMWFTESLLGTVSAFASTQVRKRSPSFATYLLVPPVMANGLNLFDIAMNFNSPDICYKAKIRKEIPPFVDKIFERLGKECHFNETMLTHLKERVISRIEKDPLFIDSNGVFIFMTLVYVLIIGGTGISCADLCISFKRLERGNDG